MPAWLAWVPSYACVAAAVACAVIAALVDLRERRLPNALVAGVALASLAQMLLATLGGLPAPAGLPSAVERLAWCAGTLVVLLACEFVWRRLRGERGLGLGDVKLLGALALWLGTGVALILAASCLSAALVNLLRGSRAFAFGPYLTFFGTLALLHACL